MITECRVWRSAHPLLYADDLREWTKRTETDLSPALRLDAEQMKLGSADAGRAFADDGGLFGDRTLVILNADSWNASDYKDLVKHLKNADTEYNLAFIFASGKPPKALADVTTAPDADYSVPKDIKALPNWLGDQFKRYDIKADRSLVTKTADYLGEDTTGAVDVLISLKQFAGKKITWADVEPQLGKRGMVAIFKFTSVISKGDIEGALELLNRMLVNDVSEFAIINVLARHYSTMLAVGFTSTPLKDLSVEFAETDRVLKERTAVRKEQEIKNMIEPRANNMAVADYPMKLAREGAKVLGQDRAIRSFTMIVEAEQGLKGGSVIPAQEVLRQLTIRLARMFELANKR